MIMSCTVEQPICCLYIKFLSHLCCLPVCMVNETQPSSLPTLSCPFWAKGFCSYSLGNGLDWCETWVWLQLLLFYVISSSPLNDFFFLTLTLLNSLKVLFGGENAIEYIIFCLHFKFKLNIDVWLFF